MTKLKISGIEDGTMYFQKRKQILEYKLVGVINAVKEGRTKAGAETKRVLINHEVFSVYNPKDQEKLIIGRTITCTARIWGDKNIKNIKNIKLIKKGVDKNGNKKQIK